MFSMFANVIIVYSLLFINHSIQEDLKVRINSKDDFCMVVPKDYQTTIGDSEYPGGEAVWCSSQASNKPAQAGTFNGNFWRNVDVTRPKDGVIQMTGCINVNTCDRLKPDDGGGQYDSNGGDGNRGNPAGSFCDPYPVYVQLIEPSANRACIRCCKNANDCPVNLDTSGCPTVIPGNYFNCNA